MRNILKQNDALRRAVYWAQLKRARAQSDEGSILDRLVADAPKTFVEFGFHPTEFNCISFCKRDDWQGALIDGSEKQVSDARFLYPKRIRTFQRFLTLDNIDMVGEIFPKVGVLSIDVDGNDYWFLERLIGIQPTIIAVEYNSTFGLAPISTPYDPDFDRHKMHARGWYHGASITALASLCDKHGYGLEAVSSGGTNLFFRRGGTLDPISAWKPNMFREQFSGIPHADQWHSVKDLPFVHV
ncbi:hypothetical protein PMI42_03272 [Bradyrhizobium sp. YR681]|uniref:hypothetical protein n=1 Tax=Bradyrhizobium sp. YR681 TaxID=1144344 RepID=UPI0002714115|nr:hypothetical protein [Bradyrhizobium sp. YR681]EJN13416.1 hypothetical protein PMI42_03272 [Bradyrhizobium sp. YR681]